MLGYWKIHLELHLSLVKEEQHELNLSEYSL